MSVDTKMSLRTSLCLANPSRMQAARWMRAGFRGACAAPLESERAATEGSPCGTGRRGGEREQKTG